MSDRDAFVRTICERPDDPGPRLVYADWLEEQGNDPDCKLAEFIRAQHTAQQNPPPRPCSTDTLYKSRADRCGCEQCKAAAAWVEACQREATILRERASPPLIGAATWGAVWFLDVYIGGFVPPSDNGGVAMPGNYYLGFLARATATSATVAENLAHVLAAVCPLREVTLADWPVTQELQGSYDYFRYVHGTLHDVANGFYSANETELRRGLVRRYERLYPTCHIILPVACPFFPAAREENPRTLAGVLATIVEEQMVSSRPQGRTRRSRS